MIYLDRATRFIIVPCIYQRSISDPELRLWLASIAVFFIYQRSVPNPKLVGRVPIAVVPLVFIIISVGASVSLCVGRFVFL